MKASEGRMGRIFVIRLEDGDIVPDCIEQFAEENGVSHGQVFLIGGIGEGEIVVGPRQSEELLSEPMLLPIDGAHEAVAVGVLAPTEKGRPVLHIHGALGRSGQAVAGCLRHGVKTWFLGEVILYEILEAAVTRITHPLTGWEMLEPRPADGKNK